MHEAVWMAVICHVELTSQNEDNVSIAFHMSITYCIWINKVFNSLTCNLFKSIDLCSFLHEGSIWSILTVVLLWYGARGPQAPARRSQRHNYWPPWPSSYKRQYRQVCAVPVYCIINAAEIETGPLSLLLSGPRILKMLLSRGEFPL